MCIAQAYNENLKLEFLKYKNYQIKIHNNEVIYSMNDNLDLLEFLKYVLGCMQISDLRTEPYNTRAKTIFEKLDLTHFSLNQVKDTIEYLNNKI